MKQWLLGIGLLGMAFALLTSVTVAEQPHSLPPPVPSNALSPETQVLNKVLDSSQPSQHPPTTPSEETTSEPQGITLAGLPPVEVQDPKSVLTTPVMNTVKDIPAPEVGDAANLFVRDPAHFLTPTATEWLKQAAVSLEKSGKGQLAIVVLPSTDRTLAEFAPEIFNAWGIGDKKQDNGLLILIHAKDIIENRSGNRIFVATGTGIQGFLPDGRVGMLIRGKTREPFKNQQYATGVVQLVATLTQIIDREYDGALAQGHKKNDWAPIVALGLVLLFMFAISRMKRNANPYNTSGPDGWFLGGGGFGGGGGGDSFDFGGGGSDGGGSGD